MKITLKIRALVFLLVFAIGCGIVWLGGYNFDHRSLGVAYGFFVLLLASILVSCFPCDDDEI
jgi:hypothetical protein